MTLSEIAKRVQKLAVDNSPGILTTIGVVGTVTTAYLTGLASFKAADIIRTEEDTFSIRPSDVRKKVQLTWKLYLPAIGTGVLTVVCIIGANRIGTRRAAALAATFSLSEKAFSEYREKIAEKIGETKERKFRDEIAQDRVNKNPPTDSQLVITDTGSVLCYDAYTGRYFVSDMETIRKAVNTINARIIHDNYASLTDFYELIGLARTSNSDEVGWNTDKLLEIQYSAVLTELGKPCMSIEYGVALNRNYHRFS